MASSSAAAKKQEKQRLEEAEMQKLASLMGEPDSRQRRMGYAFGIFMLLSLIYALSPSREYETHVRISGDAAFDVTKQLQQDHHRFPLQLKLERDVTYIINETTSQTAIVFLYRRDPKLVIARYKALAATNKKSAASKKQQQQTSEQQQKKAAVPPPAKVEKPVEEEAPAEEAPVEEPYNEEEGEPAGRRRNLLDHWGVKRALMRPVKRHTFTNHLSLSVRLLPDYPTEVPTDKMIEITINDFVGYQMQSSKVIPSTEQLVETENELDNSVDDVGDSKFEKVFAEVRKACAGVKFSAIIKHDGTFREMHTGDLRRLILNTLHRKGMLPAELEHVVQVGDKVFRANGASFNPDGKIRISADVVPVDSTGKKLPSGSTLANLGTGCSPIPRTQASHKLLVVKRGECSFLKKARVAQRALATALIVVDDRDGFSSDSKGVDAPVEELGDEESEPGEETTETAAASVDEDSSPQTYMGGVGSLDMLSVIITKKAGEYLLSKVLSSTPDVVTIKGGELAVLALHEYRQGSKVSEVDEEGNTIEEPDTPAADATPPEEDAEKEAEPEEEEDDAYKEELEEEEESFRENNLGLEQSDGLYDIVGINFVIDEILSSRFNIFPSDPVAIGDTWRRSRVIQSGVSHQDGSKITEEFHISSAKKVQSTGNLMLKITLHHVEEPANKAPNNEIAQKVSTTGRPIFVRPSANGQTIDLNGWIDVEATTGVVHQGEVESVMEWDRELLMKDFNNKEIVRKGHVRILSKTEMRGEIIRKK